MLAVTGSLARGDTVEPASEASIAQLSAQTENLPAEDLSKFTVVQTNLNEADSGAAVVQASDSGTSVFKYAVITQQKSAGEPGLLSNQVIAKLNQEPAPAGSNATPTKANSAAAPACSSTSSCSAASGCGSTCNSCESSCGDDCCHDCLTNCCRACYEPMWTFKGGALVMQRAAPRSEPLLVDTVSQRSLMNASGFSFNWMGGVDASLLGRLNDDNVLEARYFGIHQWRARQSFVPLAPAEIPINPSLPVPVDSDVASQFDDRLYDIEINWRHESSDWFTWLAGFRWMEMNDSLGITIPNAFISTMADNQLCGGQIGGEIQLWNGTSPLHIDSVFKAGVYNNDASNGSESRGQVAFIGEIGVTGVYRCCQHVALRFGYQVLWLDGVAVATDQLSQVNVSPNIPLVSNGNAFYHGAMFSVDLMW